MKTKCKSCIFGAFEDKKQVGCVLGKLDIYKEQGTRITREFSSISDSSIAKCYANEITREVTGKAMQLMGGYGYSKEFPVEQKMRDAWCWGIAGGSIDIQKTNIASALIGRRFNQRN